MGGYKRWLTFPLGIVFVLSSISCAKEKDIVYTDYSQVSDVEFTRLTLSGGDGENMYAPMSGYAEDREVGLFYFLWLGQHNMGAVYDIEKIQESNPAALESQNSSDSPMTAFHFWSEPMFGYYNMCDEWVISKHVEMLTYSMVDYLFLDLSNCRDGIHNIYTEATETLLSVLDKYQKQGFDVPQVVFMTSGDNGAAAVRVLYERYYKQNLYNDLWYRPQTADNVGNKPMILGNSLMLDEENDKEIFDFFYFKNVQNPNGRPVDANYPWIDFGEDIFNPAQHNYNGWMAVSVAQHTHGAFSWSAENRLYNRGRGWSPDDGLNNAERALENSNFQWQWNNAIENKDVHFVNVTGWNEWVAQKLVFQNKIAFTDCYDYEFSRDIEPSKTHGDGTYNQLIRNIRAFKSAGDGNVQGREKTIDLNGELSQWDGEPAYLDFSEEPKVRDCAGAANDLYFEYSQDFNDIVSVKAVNDDENIYFLVGAADTILDGMDNFSLLISTEGQGWENYDYVIDKTEDGNFAVSRLSESYTRTKIGDVQFRIDGNYLWLSVGLSTLGLSTEPIFSFKVTDGVENPADIYSYYTTGDCAPLGRMNFTYANA